MSIYEKEIKNYPKPIFYESTEIILEQMAKNICKININNSKGTGFFTKIPISDKLIPVFITNYHVINKEHLDNKKEIEVIIYNKEVNLSQVESKKIEIKNKVIYYNEAYDVTIIEIDEKRDGKYEYLELDENILNKNKIYEYLGNSIYILQYPCYYEKQKLAVSYGIIKNRFLDKEYDFAHYCSTEYGSSGSPILNIYNNKVIGTQAGNSLSTAANSIFDSIVGQQNKAELARLNAQASALETRKASLETQLQQLEAEYNAYSQQVEKNVKEAAPSFA